MAHFEKLECESAVLAALQPEPPADVGPRPLQVDGDEALPVRPEARVDVPREDGVLGRVDDGLYRLHLKGKELFTCDVREILGFFFGTPQSTSQ